MSDNRFMGSISALSLRTLFPKSLSTNHKPVNNSSASSTRFKPNPYLENTPPLDPNIQIDHKSLKTPHKILAVDSVTAKDLVSPPSDPNVKVVLSIRPANIHEREGDRVVEKVSADSVVVGDRKFTFDSVLDSKLNQEDVFQLVGVPLVKNALAGYNTSILAYGQTGSGKTYTMWGPQSAMVDSQAANTDQGIVPRIFQMLFSEIHREQENSDGKQINYQCRCSFLEIYNEQIGDLLDPTRRNLEIKDDEKHGFYVENLTEEYVTSYEDISQILIKGLSSRKVRATTINSKSYRSHIVFTFIIDSWCKAVSSNCFGSSKTSRISLVDLAGLERNKLDHVERQCVQEEKNVKKSLSQLGQLVNILAEGAPPRKPEDFSCRNSKLTHLLKESLGGNAMLAVICSISPDDKSCCETLSTLRFGQRVKTLQNEPVINQISEDDVKDLSNRIRQLKEELIKAKSNVCYSNGSKNGYSDGSSVRGSLNLLRLSLNRSLILPRIENESEEINANEEDIQQLQLQLESYEAEPDTDLASEQFESCMDESLDESSEIKESNMPISTSHCSPLLQDPTISESPKIRNKNRKNVTFHDTISESSNLELSSICHSRKKSDLIRSSLRTSKVFSGPTESLAASLQRGLQIIDSHQKNSSSNKTSVASFSFEHLALRPCLTVDKADASVQTLEEKIILDEASSSSLCISCRQAREFNGPSEVEDSLMMGPVDEAGNLNGVQESKNTGEELTEAFKREKELQEICQEQAAKIEQLNSMVAEYNLKSYLGISNEQNHVKGERKVSLSALFMNRDKWQTQKSKYGGAVVGSGRYLIRWDDGVHDEQNALKEKCEIKEVVEEMDGLCKKTSFDANEKEAILNEIESLKSKLHSKTNVPLKMSHDELRFSLLSKSIQLRKSSVLAQFNSEEELEKERQKWLEMESDWISLTEDLRIDLESNRQRAEKVEMELRLEKKCSEDLDDALNRSIHGHARMVEHYTDLQENYNDLAEKHRLIMQGIAEMRRAATIAGSKGRGSRFAKSMANELSGLRVEKMREMELLKKENKSLKIQLRDTAEAVHAAGEVLVRLREAEEAALVAEDNVARLDEENEKLRKQVEKQKRKHKLEMTTMKQYLAESRLPESALRPLYRDDSSDLIDHNNNKIFDDDEAWRAEFGAIYQDRY